MRAKAITLAKRGFRVFPLVPNGKTPAVEADWRWLASSDPLRVHGMWTDAWDNGTDHNVGVAVDDEFVVIDVDVKDGRKGAESLALLEMIYDPLPATYTVRTASGGQHLYFNTPTPLGNTVGKLGANIDTRGRSGFVVAPGSIINGVEYEVTADLPVAQIPQWVIDDVGRAPERVNEKARKTLVDLDQESNIKRAEAWLDRQPDEQAVKGAGGDAKTFEVAARVIDFGLSVGAATEAMLDHWNDRQPPGWAPERLREKVQNAWNYRQNPVGIADAEVEFDDMTSEMPTAASAQDGLRVENVMDFRWESRQDYLLKGIINFGMIGFVTGMPNAGKSPLSLDIAAHIAAGKPWRGRRVKPAYVLYVSTEGWSGIRHRMEAIRRENFADAGPIPLDFIAGTPINLRTSSKDANAIAKTILARASAAGVGPGLLVIDTLSHTLAGGDDSNQEHIRAVLTNLQKIVKATGVAVMVVHHPTKDGASDSRGSSLLTFDTDFLIKVDVDKKTKVSTVTTPRVKEYGQIVPERFKIEVVALGIDQDGDPLTSIVVRWRDDAESEFEDKTTPAEEAALKDREALALKELTKLGTATYTTWLRAYMAAAATLTGVGGSDKTFDRALTGLRGGNLVAENEAGQWFRITLTTPKTTPIVPS